MRPDQDRSVCILTSPFLSGGTGAAGHCVFVAAPLPRALGVTEVDTDVGGYSELAMVGEFCAPIPRKRGHQPVGQVLDLVDESAHNAVAVLAV